MGLPESPVQILLIEDNVDAKEIMAMMLDDAGFQTTAVSTLAAAVLEYQRSRPHVIISDLTLPDDRSGGIAAIVRGVHDHATHLIALSGRHDGQRVADQAGFNVFLLKPIKMLDLVNAIRERRLPERTL